MRTGARWVIDVEVNRLLRPRRSRIEQQVFKLFQKHPRLMSESSCSQQLQYWYLPETPLHPSLWSRHELSLRCPYGAFLHWRTDHRGMAAHDLLGSRHIPLPERSVTPLLPTFSPFASPLALGGLFPSQSASARFTDNPFGRGLNSPADLKARQYCSVLFATMPYIDPRFVQSLMSHSRTESNVREGICHRDWASLIYSSTCDSLQRSWPCPDAPNSYDSAPRQRQYFHTLPYSGESSFYPIVSLAPNVSAN